MAESDRDVSDAGQQARIALEAEASQGIVEAQRLLDALSTIEQAAGQVSSQALLTFAERLGRAYARGFHRLRTAERRALRATLDAARQELAAAADECRDRIPRP
jgi:hypothetical protein